LTYVLPPPLFHTERVLQTHCPQTEIPHLDYRLTALKLILQPLHLDTIHNSTESTSFPPLHSDQKLQLRVTYFGL